MDGQVPGMRVLTRKAASSQRRPKVGEFVLLEVMSLQVQASTVRQFARSKQLLFKEAIIKKQLREHGFCVGPTSSAAASHACSVDLS